VRTVRGVLIMIYRRLPIGAEPKSSEGTHFRVWAPGHRVELVLEADGQDALLLDLEPGGYSAAMVATAHTGSRYRYRLDSGTSLHPDPASRFQPEGPHGASQVVDPTDFRWTDQGWAGIRREGQVIYEMHVGTFTPEGTWEAARLQLPELASIGVTVIELMPIADFAGSFGWGYDGVDLFAPTRLYGVPEDLRRFVDSAHAVGLGVILDVVYNHLGPDGNFLSAFSADYFTARYKNEWGKAINFDGPNSTAVREFFISNAFYWIDEFHMDGLRLDATQQIFDASAEHVLGLITQRVRQAALGRETYVIAESESQDAKLVRSLKVGGQGMDALWNDDFHHTAMVALTGYAQAYYSDYGGSAQEFISALKWGYLFQGQRYRWQKQRRGTPALDLSPEQFVVYLQNHDQVANSGLGLRFQELTSPGRQKALTALLLLGPQTPLLFQGQEFASSAPFLFFADHTPDLARQVSVGRREFLSQFPDLALPDTAARLADPADPGTFHRCKLDFAERTTHAAMYALHRDLLRLRRTDPVIGKPGRLKVDGAVLTSHAFVIRFFSGDGQDRLLVVNLGADLHWDPAPEPLLAPPENRLWQIGWSSNDLSYGGCGTPELDTEENWQIPGESAVLLIPRVL
jgi:maltooligosyltrehalose trehalohydrolase